MSVSTERHGARSCPTRDLTQNDLAVLALFLSPCWPGFYAWEDSECPSIIGPMHTGLQTSRLKDIAYEELSIKTGSSRNHSTCNASTHLLVSRRPGGIPVSIPIILDEFYNGAPDRLEWLDQWCGLESTEPYVQVHGSLQTFWPPAGCSKLSSSILAYLYNELNEYHPAIFNSITEMLHVWP